MIGIHHKASARLQDTPVLRPHDSYDAIRRYGLGITPAPELKQLPGRDDYWTSRYPYKYLRWDRNPFQGRGMRTRWMLQTAQELHHVRHFGPPRSMQAMMQTYMRALNDSMLYGLRPEPGPVAAQRPFLADTPKPRSSFDRIRGWYQNVGRSR